MSSNPLQTGEPDEHALGAFSPAIWEAVRQLLRSRGYAVDVGCDRWQFAVELDRLEKLGVTSSDLRWLVLKGFLEHQRELTVAEDRSRRFEPCANLRFSPASNFLLAEAAVPLVESQADLESDRVWQRTDDIVKPQTPRWDSDERILWVGNQVVKEYRVRSPNQEAVLSAFEEERWPRYVDDPLSPTPEQNPKQRLRDTIKWLNSNQRNSLIRFSGDGTGERVGWRFT